MSIKKKKHFKHKKKKFSFQQNSIQTHKTTDERLFFFLYSGKLVYMFGSYITRHEPTYYVILP